MIWRSLEQGVESPGDTGVRGGSTEAQEAVGAECSWEVQGEFSRMRGTPQKAGDWLIKSQEWGGERGRYMMGAREREGQG